MNPAQVVHAAGCRLKSEKSKCCPEGMPPRSDILRKGFNRIFFAHTELAGKQMWSNATDEGIRAAKSAAQRG